jgi:hypothetical protein
MYVSKSLILNYGFLKESSRFYEEAAKYKNVSPEAWLKSAHYASHPHTFCVLKVVSNQSKALGGWLAHHFGGCFHQTKVANQ